MENSLATLHLKKIRFIFKINFLNEKAIKFCLSIFSDFLLKIISKSIKHTFSIILFSTLRRREKKKAKKKEKSKMKILQHSPIRILIQFLSRTENRINSFSSTTTFKIRFSFFSLVVLVERERERRGKGTLFSGSQQYPVGTFNVLLL